MNEHIWPAKQNVGAASVRVYYWAGKAGLFTRLELPVPFEIVIGNMILQVVSFIIWILDIVGMQGY